jgi:hypothetical protein
MKSYLKLFVAVFFILAAVRTVKAELYNVSGRVMYSDNHEIVTSGMVHCYDASNSELIGTAVIEPDGDYLLWFVRHANDADVIGFPNTEPGADWIPTGYPDKINPQQFTHITIDQNLYGVDIYVQRTQGGGGSPMVTNISGLVLDKNNKPVSGAVVYAARGGEYYGYGVSDAKGVYSIKSIPLGDYILIAHKIVHESDSRQVTVNENGLTDVNFNMNKIKNNLNITSPAKFSLSQNYPNPFNPATTIKYSVPVSGMVSLKIYNAVGQEVASVVNEFQEAGNYDMSFNASDLSSGVYYYKLSAGSYHDTKKMTLIK